LNLGALLTDRLAEVRAGSLTPERAAFWHRELRVSSELRSDKVALADHVDVPKRSGNRGRDADDVIRRRLVTASHEIENHDKYDYVLVNDCVEESSDELRAIVISEPLRRSGKPLSDEDQDQ
jgi:hypothetical protein